MFVQLVSGSNCKSTWSCLLQRTVLLIILDHMVKMESLAHAQDNITAPAVFSYLAYFPHCALGNCVLISFNGFSEIYLVC